MLNFTLCRMVLFERSPSANVKSATNVICQNISNGGSILQCLLKFKSKSNIGQKKGKKCAALSASTQAPFADGQNVGLPSDRTQVGFALLCTRGGGAELQNVTDMAD